MADAAHGAPDAGPAPVGRERLDVPAGHPHVDRPRRLLEPLKYVVDRFFVAPLAPTVLFFLGALLTGPIAEPKIATMSRPSVAGVVTAPRGATIYRLQGGVLRTMGTLPDTRHVHFTGYCIGSQRPTGRGLPDVRWLILPEGNIVPAADLWVRVPPGLEPVVCPFAERPGPSDNPRALTLNLAIAGSEVRMRATAPGTALIGFAIYSRASREWRSAGLRHAANGRAELAIADPGPAAVLAVACWAPWAPAHPVEPQGYVQQIGFLHKPPASIYERAALEATAAGVAHACAPAADAAPRPLVAGGVATAPLTIPPVTTQTTITTPMPQSPDTRRTTRRPEEDEGNRGARKEKEANEAAPIPE